jgi:hypothetical protein
MDPSSQTTITPHNQQPLVTRTYPSEEELDGVITRAALAQKAWARVPLKDRIAIGTKFLVCTYSLCRLIATHPAEDRVMLLGRVREDG